MNEQFVCQVPQQVSRPSLKTPREAGSKKCFEKKYFFVHWKFLLIKTTPSVTRYNSVKICVFQKMNKFIDCSDFNLRVPNSGMALWTNLVKGQGHSWMQKNLTHTIRDWHRAELNAVYQFHFEDADQNNSSFTKLASSSLNKEIDTFFSFFAAFCRGKILHQARWVSFGAQSFLPFLWTTCMHIDPENDISCGPILFAQIRNAIGCGGQTFPRHFFRTMQEESHRPAKAFCKHFLVQVST